MSAAQDETRPLAELRLRVMEGKGEPSFDQLSTSHFSCSHAANWLQVGYNNSCLLIISMARLCLEITDNNHETRSWRLPPFYLEITDIPLSVASFMSIMWQGCKHKASKSLHPPRKQFYIEQPTRTIIKERETQLFTLLTRCVRPRRWSEPNFSWNEYQLHPIWWPAHFDRFAHIAQTPKKGLGSGLFWLLWPHLNLHFESQSSC